MAIYKVASAEQSLNGLTPPSPYYYSSFTTTSTSQSSFYYIREITVDSSKNSIVSYQRGDSNGSCIAKYDEYGNLTWGYGYKDAQSYYDMGGHTIDSSGNIYFAGGTYQSYYNRPHLVKLNSSGSIVWQKQYGDANSQNGGQLNDVVLDSSGNIYAVGYARFNENSARPYIAKYDSSGTKIWDYRYMPSTDGIFYNIAIDNAGNIWAAGYAYDGGNTNANAFVVKVDSSGNPLLQRTFSEATNQGQSIERGNILIDSSDNVYLGIQSSNGTYYSGQLIKLNSSGTLQWQRKLSGSFDVYTRGVSFDASGNIVVGYSVQNVGQVVAVYNSSGTIQWQKVLTLKNGQLNAGMDYFTVDSFNNIYFGVSTSGLVGSGNENGVVKLPSSINASYSTALLKMGLQYLPSSITESAGSLTMTTSTYSTSSVTLTTSNSSSGIYAIPNSLSKVAL